MKKIVLLLSAFMVLVFVSVQKRRLETSSFDLSEPWEDEEDERTDEPFKFQEYINSLKIRDGQTKSEYAPSYQFLEHQTALSKAFRRKAGSTSRTQSGNGVTEWKERGPGNIPGRTRALVDDPDDPNHATWYAGSAGGGIWKTTNGGSTWTWLTPALPNLATTSMAMANSNHNVLYVGTGEGFGNLDGISGHGVFKSTDRGATWNLLNTSIPMGDINRLVIHPNNSDSVIVASNIGIYVSGDGGVSWTQTYTGLVQDIDATPGNFSVLYGGEYRKGVIKSTDAGQTWQLSSVGLSPSGRVELAISPINTNRIFASVEGTLSGNHSDLFMSDDAGLHWSLLNLSLSGKTVDFLSAVNGTLTQGTYDNTIACSPYDQNVVYVGGIGVFQVAISSGSTVVQNWLLDESATQSFLLLQQFSNVIYDGGKMDVGNPSPQSNVEVRFGVTQKAHRFTVPTGSTSGVPDNAYTYADYVDVNFQVWDVTGNRQLMVSFRDQNGNGKFDLMPQDLTGPVAINQSREYVYIQGITYSTTASTSIAVTGGHKTSLWYNIFPALAAGADPNATHTGTLTISYLPVSKLNTSTASVSDPYGDYDNVNNNTVIHPDHHFLLPIPIDNTGKRFKILDANDGGVYVSNLSTSPGTSQGGWTAIGRGFNTGQFYGVDKRVGVEEYVGGLQDNGTQKSPVGEVATEISNYKSVIGGDGFEVIWNNNDDKKIIGGYYGNHFQRTIDGGVTWLSATTGLSTATDEFPFVSRLANSRNNPDVLFTVGKSGVWKSSNFGGTWKLVPITQNWQFSNLIDVEVSAANANVVWAGAAMSASSSIYVSTDNGESFHQTVNYNGATLGLLSHISTHPTQSHTAYALFSFAHSAKILRTTDLGQTWEDISGFGGGTTSANGFPDVAVYSLYVRPDNPNIIWAGTEIGIVESLDNGVSWAMLTDFPSVSIWDLKGADDEVIIGTHGRGIWSAKIGQVQMPIQNPAIVATGTSPQSKFVAQVHFPQAFDSTLVLISNSVVGKLGATTSGDYLIQIGNVSAGSVTLEVISYINGAPAHGKVTAVQLGLMGYQTKYYTYFGTSGDFATNGFSLSTVSGIGHKTLQTSHPYPSSSSLSATLLIPIIVGNTLPNLYYNDITLVQHGANGILFGDPAFKDYVIVEATRDGITWIPLANGYNSSGDPAWKNAYDLTQNPTGALEKSHNLLLTQSLQVGDTVLFRFRLTSDTDGITGWGWSISEVTIQQTPTGLEPSSSGFDADIYPNPSSGQFTVRYTLPTSEAVLIHVLDIQGKVVGNYPLGTRQKGENLFEITSDLPTGTYLVVVKAGKNQLVRKAIVSH